MPQIAEKEVIKERLRDVKKIMQDEQIDVYVVCTGDYHMSEYAGEYFAERSFLSGFTGSAGTLVITEKETALFTDGRYFVQATLQLDGTGIVLMRSGCADVPSVEEYCAQKIPQEGVLGLDGRTVSAKQGKVLEEAVQKNGGKVKYTFNAVERIWNDRPAFPQSPVYEISAGEERREKLRRLRAALEQQGADMTVIAALDDICWLLNLRGNDVKCNPVFMAYCMVTKQRAVLYTSETRLTSEMKLKLNNDGVELRPYEQIDKDIDELRNAAVLADSSRLNMEMYKRMEMRCEAGICILDRQNPTVHMKAVKNPVEIMNLRAVHIEDGLAVTRFMYWLKNAMDSGQTVTEVTAAAYLDDLRSKIQDYIEPSFETISAYGANAAMMHYAAAADNCAVLKPEGMLLVDSGGQYLRGTTDVTRTFALGSVTDQMKRHFTLTLKGMLALTNAHFLKGCTGYNLDILARQPLWDIGMDYRCGTGHGVGYLLNVHEAPNGFRWKHCIGKNDLCVIEPGMVTSNEPGVYIDGAYGIRIENEIVCVHDYENEYGTFLKFDTLTCVPVDLDLVEPALLNDTDRNRLNDYHQWVYQQLSPYMQTEELAFLKKYTRQI